MSFKAAGQKVAAVGAMEKKSECVQVVVRCRPLFGKEIAEGR
jgi:hypothetical protein